MALLGEGDPRWIVSQREDGKNVNAWHWEDKSILPQVKQRLEDMFRELPVESQQGSYRITNCKEVTGDAHISTRKGNKKLVFFDLKVTLEFEGLPLPSSTAVKGSIKIEEYSTASEEDDYVLEVSTTGSGADVDATKKVMDSQGRQQVIRMLHSLAKELEAMAQS